MKDSGGAFRLDGVTGADGSEFGSYTQGTGEWGGDD